MFRCLRTICYWMTGHSRKRPALRVTKKCFTRPLTAHPVKRNGHCLRVAQPTASARRGPVTTRTAMLRASTCYLTEPETTSRRGRCSPGWHRAASWIHKAALITWSSFLLSETKQLRDIFYFLFTRSI